MPKKTFSYILEKFCVKTTILGLKYFYLYPDRISRIFWAVSLLFILSFASMLTFLLWFRFRDMPTRITIESQYSSVLDLPYPSIALCTPNQMTLSNVKHLQKTLVDGNLTFDIKEKLPQLMGFYEPIGDVSYEDLAQFQNLIELNRHNVRDVMSHLPQSCDQFLVHCIFEMEIIDCMEIFKPILTAHGLCCIFNNPYGNRRQLLQNVRFEPLKPKYPGLYGGLTVLTDYRPEDALPGTLVNSGAVLVMINDWTEFPSDDESSLVYPHVESLHRIVGVETYCSEDVMTLNIESRKCVFPEEHHLQYFHQYRNADCDLECFMLEIWKRCHCIMFYMPFAPFRDICNFNNVPCIMDTRGNMSLIGSNTEKCDCPRDCHSRQYRAHMNIGNFKAHQFIFFDHFYKGLTVSNSSTLMHLHFANPLYVRKKQETVMSLINLTSNLGGVFGVCLGCSVISVLELIFFAYKAIQNARRNYCEEKKRKKAVLPVKTKKIIK